MPDTTHLVALVARLASERQRLASAKSPQEVALRAVWVSQIEAEIVAEEKFLGMAPTEPYAGTLDDILAELTSP